MTQIHDLSDELGASYQESDDSIILWDIRNETPERREHISSTEMTELIDFYLDGCCPVCFEPIPPGHVICDSCLRDAQSARAGK